MLARCGLASDTNRGQAAICPDSESTRRAATQTANQQEQANHRKREAEDDQPDWDELLMVRLALGGAVRDQQEQPKECGGQNSYDDECDAKGDSDDRFHCVDTG